MTEQQQISRSQAWLESLRPKTLPLAFAAIIVGTALAWWQGYFNPLVALLALITAGLLQILSNLANDYGDAVKGSDKPDRIGPLRGMQKGVITQQQMKRALIVTVVLICLSGLALVAVACHTLADFVGFLVLGGLSIIAAITYTVGNRPYGYIGLGDISVLVFFGWLSVMGSWYLQAHTLIPALILPATACGLLATSVLNINNVRDIETDAASGKITLAVRLGRNRAIAYHWVLLGAALLATIVFILIQPASFWPWIFLPAMKPLTDAARTLRESLDGEVLTGALKKTAISAFLFSLLLSVGLALS